MHKKTLVGNMTPIDRKLVEIGMTRAALSRLSGVPVRTLENWSSRFRKNPNVYQLYKVSKVLGCSIEDLLEPELMEASQADGQQVEEGEKTPNE